MTVTHWFFLGCGVLFLFLLNSLSAILLPFLAGCIGAYALNPFVTRLEKHGFGRSLATTLVMILFIALISVFLMILIPYMHQELLAIYQHLPTLSNKLLELTSPLIERLSHDFGLPTMAQLKTKVSSHIGDVAQIVVAFLLNILNSGMVVANIISILVLTPVVMFYFLKDWKTFLRQLRKLMPPRFLPKVEYYARRVHRTLGEYAKGQSLVCLILMTVYIISLSLIKLPDAFFIGFLTGFLAFIPYLGAIVGLLLSLIVGLMNFVGWWQIVSILVIYSVVNLFEGNFLTPKLVGEKVGLHPIWIIFSLLAAATWFGFMGVIVTIPVAAIIGTLVRLLIEEYYQSRLYNQS